MASINFVLSPEGVIRLHDAIICLSKFHESIGWQASRDKLLLSATNSSKTAAATVSFNAVDFFETYSFNVVDASGQRSQPAGVVFSCSILAKALLLVFKGRSNAVRDTDSSVESCEVGIDESDGRGELRLVIRMICRHGVIKTYKLTYEANQIKPVKFDHSNANNVLKINAQVLRAFSEYFGARTEYLDLYYDNPRFVMTSYTEKITKGSEILKQPLQTSVNLDRLDFETFNVEEKMHVGINIKDFRAIITHAESLQTFITARYSQPQKPLQLGYEEHGMHCQFTLMTIGKYRGGSVTPAPALASARQTSARPSGHPDRMSGVQQAPDASRPNDSNSASYTMPPPTQPASRSFTQRPTSQAPTRPSPPPPQASVNQDSLFLQDDDEEEEHRWGEKTYDDDQDELTWETGDTLRPGGSRVSDRTPQQKFPDEQGEDEEDQGVPPTQRLSQVHGLFD